MSALSKQSICQLYPEVFGSHIRPLKIGIANDLMAAHPALPKKLMHTILGGHTRRVAYIAALAAGGPRYALDGTPSGEVTEQERSDARARLKTIRESKQENQLAEKARSQILKDYEANTLSFAEFAEHRGMSHDQLTSDPDKARHERARRHAARLKLVESYKSSGLDIETFAAKSGKSVAQVTRAINKLSLIGKGHDSTPRGR